MDTFSEDEATGPAGARRDPETARRRILDAGAAEFAAVGFAGARVDRIADLAGFNKRMLYHYFGDKQAVYAAVLADRLKGLTSVSGRVDEQLNHLVTQLDQTLARLLIWRLLESRPESATADDGLGGEGLRAALESLRREGGLPGDLDVAALARILMAHLVLSRARSVAGAEDGSLMSVARLLRSMTPREVPDRRKPRVRLKPAVSAGPAADFSHAASD
jgi:AcrR family transcriptional regulator